MITNRRIQAMQKLMTQAGLDAVLFAPSADMQYLLDDTTFFWQRTPYTGHYLLKDTPFLSTEKSYFHCRPDLLLWIPAEGEAAVLTTFDRARRMIQTKPDVVCYFAMLTDHLKPYAKGTKKVGVGLGCESHLKEMLGEIDSSVEVVSAQLMVESLRKIKDEKEIAALRKAAEFTDYTMGEIVKILRPGVTQWQVETKLNELALERSCMDLPFDPSCSFLKTGDPRCMKHGGIPKDEPLTPGTSIAFDYGFVMDGYCSDFGRSFYCGKAPEKIANAYKALQTAQVELLEQIKPGVSLGITFDALGKTLDRFGFKDNLSNFANIGMMGHQIGIDTHEEPWLYNGSELVFEPGMVMTIEPKIFIPGEVFMRVEDMVLITENGCESLTRFDRDLYELPLD